ncbi:MAG: hypothetical protein R3Y63_13785 [Eubacteriales bacterium]
MKKYSQDGTLTEAVIEVVLGEKADKPKKITLNLDTARYFPKGTSKTEIEKIMMELLEEYLLKNAKEK